MPRGQYDRTKAKSKKAPSTRRVEAGQPYKNPFHTAVARPTDATLAGAVRALSRQLNDAIREAEMSGLDIILEVVNVTGPRLDRDGDATQMNQVEVDSIKRIL